MAKQDKIVASILLAHGSLGAIWSIWLASQNGFPLVFLVSNLVLAATGTIAGIGWFAHRRSAAYLGIAFYLVQLFHVLTPAFAWSFTLGFNLNITLGWLSSGQFGINLLALAMLLWSIARAFAPNNSFKPTPLRGAA